MNSRRIWQGIAGMLLGLAMVTAIAVPAPASGRTPATGRVAASAAALRVATFNICKSTCGKGQFVWANRRLALVRTVGEAKPDILAVQEANTKVWNGVRHIDDVIGLLAPLGYQITSTDFSGCPLTCTRGAHIFFNTATVQLASLPRSAVPAAGMSGMAAVGGVSLGAIQDRAISWAFLSAIGSSRVTLMVSVHLATEKTAEGEAARVAVAAGLRPWADALIAASGQPGVALAIAGDFNSYARRQPNGAQQVLANTGLVDGYSAPELVNGDISSINMAPRIARYKGFPPAPYRYRSNTTHIDYVFSSVPPLRHEVVVHLDAAGNFDNAYRVSDHNMVMVDLPVR